MWEERNKKSTEAWKTREYEQKSWEKSEEKPIINVFTLTGKKKQNMDHEEINEREKKKMILIDNAIYRESYQSIYAIL